MAIAQAHHQAAELIRKQQQGLGRPIISAKLKDQQIVAVGKKIYNSSKWRTFIDFLDDYIKGLLTPEWGSAELAKPFSERHPVIQWYDAKVRQQKAAGEPDGTVKSTLLTGASTAYYGLAYGLYLLDHNVELQNRLLARLRDQKNFQGAYYEVLIANVLIRAGFELVLEDEGDRASKHCEFAAISRATGRRYWIEAKMKAVNGFLAKTAVDGSSDSNPISHLVTHVSKALAKPADAQRLIFVDLNTEMNADLSEETAPDFIELAERRLIRFEKSTECGGAEAYIFLTNIAFHRGLEEAPKMVVMPFGLNRPDFNRPALMSVSEAYRREQKHSEAFAIAAAFENLTKFPATFDGELPAEAFDGALPPVKVGQTYFFEGVDGGAGVEGTVTTATVVEPERVAYVAITTKDGRNMILQQPMSDAELDDYRSHRDGYFGEVRPVPKGLKSPLDMFKFLLNGYAETPRSKFIEWLRPHFSAERLEAMSDEELRMTYCEGMTAATMRQTAGNDGRAAA